MRCLFLGFQRVGVSPSSSFVGDFFLGLKLFWGSIGEPNGELLVSLSGLGDGLLTHLEE